jgi:DNA replication protein DnaC
MEWMYPDPNKVNIFEVRMVRCPVCGEGREQEYLQRICGLAPEMYGWLFENTKIPFPGFGQAFDHMRGLALAPAWCATLTGAYGSGKTRLLACLVNAGRAARWTSVYATMSEILEHLRKAYRPEAEISFDGLWEKLVAARILAIDECDRWNPTPWAQEKFFDLIDARYRAGADHCTAFATNKSVDELPGYLASRLHDRRCRVFDFGPTAVDMRQM